MTVRTNAHKMSVEIGQGMSYVITVHRFFFSLDVLSGCGVKQEGSSVERWTKSHRQEVISELPQEADCPTATLSPEREPQVGHNVYDYVRTEVCHADIRSELSSHIHKLDSQGNVSSVARSFL